MDVSCDVIAKRRVKVNSDHELYNKYRKAIESLGKTEVLECLVEHYCMSTQLLNPRCRGSSLPLPHLPQEHEVARVRGFKLQLIK